MAEPSVVRNAHLSLRVEEAERLLERKRDLHGRPIESGLLGGSTAQNPGVPLGPISGLMVGHERPCVGCGIALEQEPTRPV